MLAYANLIVWIINDVCAHSTVTFMDFIFISLANVGISFKIISNDKKKIIFLQATKWLKHDSCRELTQHKTMLEAYNALIYKLKMTN